MNKIAMYKEEIFKEASVKKEYNKAMHELDKKKMDVDYQEALNMAHSVNRRMEKKYPKEQYSKERIMNMLKGAVPGLTAGTAATLLSKVDNKPLAASLGFTAASLGSAVGALNTDKKYIKHKTEAIREELDSHNKTTKKASETLDELVKEAGVITHASKATNGIKRAGQLLTGSYARGLKKSLKNMNKMPAGSFQDSLKTGEKMLLTQKELGKELGKVKATRLGTVGAVGTVGTTTLGKNKKQEQNLNM